MSMKAMEWKVSVKKSLNQHWIPEIEFCEIKDWDEIKVSFWCWIDFMHRIIQNEQPRTKVSQTHIPI